MKISALRFLPAIAACLLICGCGAIESRKEPVGAASPAPPSATSASPALVAATSPAGQTLGVAPTTRPADSLHKLDLHIYGLSYHTDRQGVKQAGVDNEVNPGLGLGYEFHNDELGAAFFAIGFYKDSGRNWAKLAGPGYQFKLGEHWRLGASVPLIQSTTYNQGRAFVAAIPLLTYDFGAVKLNAIYAPRYPRYNNFAVFGVYLGIPLPK